MAKVTPYACATAHGQLNKTLQFKRGKNKIILGKITQPAYTNTAAQQPSRQDFKDAVLRYQLRNYSEKTFLDKRSKEIPGGPFSLWMTKYMKDEIWSRDKPIGVTTVENMVIQDPVGSQSNNAIISIEGIISNLEELGCMMHNTLGSDDEVENSSRGVDGVITGNMTYLPAKFGNGVYDWSSANYITFPNVHVFKRGILDHWWIPDFYSGDQAFAFADVMRINNLPGVYNVTLGWVANYGPWRNVFWMYGYDAGLRCRYFFTPLPFNADEKVHLEWIIHYANPPGSRYRLFQNGIELAIALIDYDNELDPTSGDVDIIALWAPSHSQAIMDNLKIYPSDTYLTTIAANREFEYFSPDPLATGPYGHVTENDNIFTPGEDIEDAPAQRIAIENTGGYDLEIPFRYYIAVTWSGPGVSSRTSLIRFPKMTIPIGQTAYLYLSGDWSTYYDKTLRDLACTNKM